jgi:hypothetical protein
MTKQHNATPEQWAFVEACAPEDFAGYACILELRDRIEALEAAQQPPQDKLDRLIALDRDDPAEDAAQQPPLFTAEEVARIVAPSPESPLVERVADAIAAQATSAGIVNDRPARAAILEVAAWLRKKGYASWVTLEREANQ